MNYKDELKKNKKVTEADRKFVENYIAPKMSKEASTEELINGLTNFIYKMQSGYGVTGFANWVCNIYKVPQGRALQCFDRARYLVLKLDSDTYMRLID